MKNYIKLSGLLIVSGFIAAGCIASNSPANNSQESQNTKDVKVDGATRPQEVSDDNMMVNASPQTYQGEVLAGESAPLLDFNFDDYQQALQDGKIVFLYFFANWCPTCIAEQPALLSAFEELDSAEIVGFRVNYKDDQTDDNEVGLARQFGVAYQHTKVAVLNGKVLLKSPASWSSEDYSRELQKLLNN